MNRNIAQLSLITALLAASATASPVARAQEVAAVPVAAMLTASNGAEERTPLREISILSAGQSEAGAVSDTRQKISRPYRLFAGVHFTQSASVNRGAGVLRSFEFEYDYAINRMLGGPTVISFFADVNSNKRYVRPASAEYNFVSYGLGATVRRVFTGSLDRSHSFAGLGLGIFGMSYRIDPFGPARYQETQYSPGFRILGGYQFGTNFYLQADYQLLDTFRINNASGQSIRIDPSGTRVGFGYRF